MISFYKMHVSNAPQRQEFLKGCDTLFFLVPPIKFRSCGLSLTLKLTKNCLSFAAIYSRILVSESVTCFLEIDRCSQLIEQQKLWYRPEPSFYVKYTCERKHSPSKKTATDAINRRVFHLKPVMKPRWRKTTYRGWRPILIFLGLHFL